MIYIIDPDQTFASCISRAVATAGEDAKIFPNAIDAMNALDDELPSLIFLEIFLPGPNGFSFLNEIISYPDTAKIPVVIVSNQNFKNAKNTDFNIVETLDKKSLRPEQIINLVKTYAEPKNV